jgi:uncharacterized protein YceK
MIPAAIPQQGGRWNFTGSAFENTGMALNMKNHAFFLLICLVLSGCGDPLPDDIAKTNGNPESLANAVYAGPDSEGSWTTIAFHDEDTAHYFPGNVFCATGAYTYDPVTAAGDIPRVSYAKPPEDPGSAPGAFSIGDKGRTITFMDYAGRGEWAFRRVRGTDLVDDEVPFTFEPLKDGDSLDGTVWAATALRRNDWTTLTVTSKGAINEGAIDVSHSFDCTSFSRAYSNYMYNASSSLEYIGYFKIKDDSFTFLNFYGHGGEITLKRMR